MLKDKSSLQVPPGLVNVTTIALAETFWGKTMGKKGIDKQPPPPGKEKLLKKTTPCDLTKNFEKQDFLRKNGGN